MDLLNWFLIDYIDGILGRMLKMRSFGFYFLFMMLTLFGASFLFAMSYMDALGNDYWMMAMSFNLMFAATIPFMPLFRMRRLE